MLDTIREIETPEGIALRLRAAGALPRSQAWMIDMVLRLAVFSAAMIPLSLLGVGGKGLGMLLMFALMWFYSVVCEVWFHGQTLGKRALGLRVVNADGTPVTWMAFGGAQPAARRRCLARRLWRGPGQHPDRSPCASPWRHRGRHDGHPCRRICLPASRCRSSPAVPLPLVLAQDEQAALVEFAERSGQLTLPRQEELANMLSRTHRTSRYRRRGAADRACQLAAGATMKQERFVALHAASGTGSQSWLSALERQPGAPCSRNGREDFPHRIGACATTWRWPADAATAMR